MENNLSDLFIQRLKITSLSQGGGIFWREQRRRAQGIKTGWIVTKFSTVKNNK